LPQEILSQSKRNCQHAKCSGYHVWCAGPAQIKETFSMEIFTSWG
jgi:hypothetical protein